MSEDRIVELERKIGELNAELTALRKISPGTPVPDYTFRTQNGDATLRGLFGDRDKLLAIQNMGQGCRYCTLWADGFNGLLPHLESALAVVLVSKDPPDVQRKFANSRGWRFRLASHGGGDYIREQGVLEGGDNYPGRSALRKERRHHRAQERVRVRPRRPVLRDVGAARVGRTGRGRLDAPVQLLAAPRATRRRRRERARLRASYWTRVDNGAVLTRELAD